MYKYYVGIDIGGTTIKFGLFDDKEELIDKWSIETDISSNGKNIVPSIATSLNKYFSDKNINMNELGAIGLDIPGPTISGDKVKKAVNLNWKEEFNIAKLMKASLNSDSYIYALNDANAAAYGEYKKGAGMGYKSMFMVTIGTGIGGAIIYDDEIIEGMQGGAGEIGHIKVCDKYEIKCNCGGVGCLETIAAKNGIINLAIKNLKDSKYKSILRDKSDTSKIDVKEICDLAKSGDELSIATIKESMYYVGKALSYVSEIFEPECLIIGGGVAKAGDIILNNIIEGYNNFSTMTTVKPKMCLAKLENEAGIYGSMLMAKKMRG